MNNLPGNKTKRIKIITKKRNLTKKLLVEQEEKAEQEINDLCDKPNNVLKLVKF